MNRRKSIYLVVIVLLLTQLSCQFVTGMFGGGGGSGYYTAPGNPIDVSITLDSANVTEVVPAAGGEMSVTGSDGTRYTLSIPPEALVVDTEISMTPIASITGLPFSGGLGGAVKLEPSGLSFFDFLTLTIEPANPIPLENQILFGFEEDGEDLHLAIPGADYSKIQIRLLHFSGAGVASGTSADSAGVAQHSPDGADARYTGQVGQYMQEQRNGQNPDSGGVEESSSEFQSSVVTQRLKAAMSSSATCKEGQEAIQTYLSFERLRAILGTSPESDDAYGRLAKQVFPIVAKKCVDEEFDRCANKHMVAGMLYLVLGISRQAAIMGVDMSEIEAYAESLMRKCYQWDLEFESAGTFEDKEGISYDSRVKAKVPIRFDGNIHGKSALNNVDFTFKIPGCKVTSNRGGGEFTVFSLTWDPVVRKDSDGELRTFVQDFHLKYNPGKTSESMVIACPDSPSMPVPPGPLWTALFITTHIKEADQSGTAISPSSILGGGVPPDAQVPAYIAKNWRVNEAELMATKEWQGTSELDGAVFEGGEFRLIHRPQK